MIDQYLTSLNWSFAMLGVGLSTIQPTNTLETAFFVIVAFRSLMTYATLVSSITTLTSALTKIKEDETSEFRLLRSYMTHNNISSELSHKIFRFLQHQYHLRQEAKSAHANVPILDLLSATLRRELEFARNAGSMHKLTFIEGPLVKGISLTVKGQPLSVDLACPAEGCESDAHLTQNQGFFRRMTCRCCKSYKTWP